MRLALLFGALLSLGCNNGVIPTANIGGTWAADFAIPGASLVLTIDQVDSSLTGSGTYAIEAGRAGTLQVVGTYACPTVTMSLQYDHGLRATFTGTVNGSRQMSGTLADTLGHSSSLTLMRQ